MSANSRILVVAATEHELATPSGWIAVACGVGPIEAAAATATAIAEHQPALILHVGIAGARRHRALAPASLVIGGESRYCDADPATTWAPVAIVAPEALVAIAQRALPNAAVATIGTSARVGGTSDCDVEAMEGFAVLRAAQRANIPAIEVRAISNEIEESDRRRWHFSDAFRAITHATPQLVDVMRSSLTEHTRGSLHA